MSRIDMLEPSRAMLRTESALPKPVKSKIDMHEANREVPNREKAAPRRAKVRRDSEEPMCRKSRTDNDDPKRL